MKLYLAKLIKHTDEPWEKVVIATFTSETEEQVLADAARQYPEYAEAADEAVKKMPKPAKSPLGFGGSLTEKGTRHEALISWARTKGLGVYSKA